MTTRLYAIPLSCSLAAHIALREAQVAHELSWVTRQSLVLRSGGGDLRQFNPKGKVSTLVLEDGTVVTENVAVLLCIAELGKDGALRPPTELLARVRLFEWLTFISTELHKQVLTPSFDPATPDVTRQDVVSRLLPPVLSHAAAGVNEREFLLGDRLSVADIYLFWTLLLLPYAGVALEPWPSLIRFRDQLLRRETFAGAVKLERRAFTEGENAQ